MNEFDRFFDGDDVAREVDVYVVKNRGQRRRFARTGRTSHQNESAAQMPEFLDDRRNAKLIEALNLRRDETKDRAVAVRLFEIIAAEPRMLIHFVGEIEVAA